MSEKYRVELDIFTGPLDLLLYLVRRNELDIVDLPISTLTKQFQEFLEVLKHLDLDLVGDFVVMASTLAEIKSRNVLPSQAEEEIPLEAESNSDPRSDLIHQLLEYKKFKDAANSLQEQAAEWQERYPRLADERPVSSKDPAADRIKEVELWDLVSALGRVLKRKEVDTESKIRYDETPIHKYVDQIGALVREQKVVQFTSLFEGEIIRSKIIGMFLAVLELIRHHGFRAEQIEDHGEIVLQPPEEVDEQAETQESVPPEETEDAPGPE
ncbi:segregation and condensation protein A [Thalassoglobus polymorphus]|uniref:Segregation and condensation protein A n=1 Tax=Thalassoglobus polymorphus TaxID=2527994 RepID=A0A517QUE9_9PLAN|nr:segregation/condensation protein A [Thalassoglobus polymorphus]QDT35248.1 Segregation and condensation protein A [Thalassoglobus polymorphus]